MKKLTVVRCFRDLKEGVDRNPDDSFIASDERAEELKGYGLVTVEDLPEDETETQVQPKKRARKKKE